MWGHINNKIIDKAGKVMKRRYVRGLIASLVMSTFIATTVMAAPDTDAIQQQKDEAQSQVNSLQSQLTEVLGKINDLETKLISKGEEITQATEDLAAAEEKEKEQYEAMKLRIKYMYEQGTNTAIEKVFSSGSISELLNQAEYVQNVHNYDRNQLDEYVATKEKIATLKDTLEKEQKELEETQQEFASEKENLNSTLESKQAEVADLDQQLQAAVEAAAREAEEKAAAEAAAAAQASAQQSGGSSSQGGGSGSSGGTSNQGGGSGSGGGSSSQGGGSGSGGTSSSQGGGSSSNNTSAASAIVSAAYSQLGTPYVWGGTTPYKALDCSGLTQYCHRVAGISIPRTSGPQGAGGQYVSSPQPGDIVCYSGHVGIYIGGGQMIHAPQPGDVVRVASVYGSPWYRRYW